MKPPLWTIGHSNHTAEKFLALLELHAIACVVDVRSIPYSRRNPQFGKERLADFLASRGVDYLWEGEALGGKRDPAKNPEFFEASGRIDWARVRQGRAFCRAMERLRERVGESSAAVFCAEENPRNCHRLHLVAVDWVERFGAEALHVRGDGRVETHARCAPQPELFR